MGSRVAAKFKANAARETARMNAEEISRQILGIVAGQHGMTIGKLEKDLKDHPEKRGQSVNDPDPTKCGYKETFAFAEDMVKRDRAADKGELRDIRVGASDGTALSGQLGPGIAFLGALAGLQAEAKVAASKTSTEETLARRRRGPREMDDKEANKYLDDFLAGKEDDDDDDEGEEGEKK
jgi:hypothetical protein